MQTRQAPSQTATVTHAKAKCFRVDDILHRSAAQRSAALHRARSLTREKGGEYDRADECEDPTLLTPAFLHLLRIPRHHPIHRTFLTMSTIIVRSFRKVYSRPKACFFTSSRGAAQ